MSGTKERLYEERVRFMFELCEGEPHCKRCGMTDLRALTIDHMDGVSGIPTRPYRPPPLERLRMMRKQLSEGRKLQVLCMSCQFIVNDERKTVAAYEVKP